MDLQAIIKSTLGGNPNNVDNNLLTLLTGGQTPIQQAQFDRQHPTLAAMRNNIDNYITSNSAPATAQPTPIQNKSIPQNTVQPITTVVTPTYTNNPNSVLAQAVQKQLVNTNEQQPVAKPTAQSVYQAPIVQPTAQSVNYKNIDELLRAHPELLSTDRIWQAARKSRNSDAMNEGFAGGYSNNGGIGYQGNPTDIMDASGTGKQKELAWYKNYLASHLNDYNTQYQKEAENNKPENLYQSMLQNELTRLDSQPSTPDNLEKKLTLAKEITGLYESKQNKQNTLNLENKKLETELEKQRLANEGAVGSAFAKAQQKQYEDQVKKEAGFQLPATAVEKLSQTRAGISQLTGLMKTVDTLPVYVTTPGTSQLSVFNPFDTGVQSFNQLVAATKQIIGKGLEGGVLRAEDEKKYEKIIPKLGDTKETLVKKGQQLEDLLINKYVTDINSYKEVGYGTGSMPMNITPSYKTNLSFNSEQEAEQANLPSGTIVTINGRQAVIED